MPESALDVIDRIGATDGGEPEVHRVVMTPEAAQRLIAMNTGNRRRRPLLVAKYARDMASGRFPVTGEAIKVDRTGRLIDGQHRLYACIQARTPFETFLITNLAPESQAFMDQGAKRTLGDVLGLLGISNPNVVASIVKLSYQWSLVDGPTRNLRQQVVGHGEIEEYAKKHRETLEVAAAEAYSAHRHCGVRPTAWGTFWFTALIQDFDQELLNQFATGVYTGVNLAEGDPRLTLRNWFSNSGRLAKEAETHLLAITKAWNAYAVGNQVRLLRVLNSDLPKLERPIDQY